MSGPNLACVSVMDRGYGRMPVLRMKFHVLESDPRKARARALRTAATVEDKSFLEKWYVVAPPPAVLGDKNWLIVEVGIELHKSDDKDEEDRAIKLLKDLAKEMCP